jgi:hypothetical protein
MKVLKAAAILLIGPLGGLLIAFFLSAFVLPPDPNFVSDGGHAAPGDGFIVLGFMFVSLVVSIPLSAALAGFVLFRKPNSQTKDQISQ